ncbi:hypothetical protein SAMN04489764_0771 [Thermostaphylospora chromogena]|uniref:Uncharacterized protein n=1 Tax=Thermostaphylospora chromogena TaxID=35622 RepID=A0A1H1B451_9ACTN|nr:hypothetical protein SAMN04489764_0771 [Thermostaphylospora chromogena]
MVGWHKHAGVMAVFGAVVGVGSPVLAAWPPPADATTLTASADGAVRAPSPAGRTREQRLRLSLDVEGQARDARLAVAATASASVLLTGCRVTGDTRPDTAGAEACSLGDLSGARTVEVRVSVPPEAEEVAIAAVARARSATGEPVVRATVATVTGGPEAVTVESAAADVDDLSKVADLREAVRLAGVRGGRGEMPRGAGLRMRWHLMAVEDDALPARPPARPRTVADGETPAQAGRVSPEAGAERADASDPHGVKLSRPRMETEDSSEPEPEAGEQRWTDAETDAEAAPETEGLGAMDDTAGGGRDGREGRGGDGRAGTAGAAERDLPVRERAWTPDAVPVRPGELLKRATSGKRGPSQRSGEGRKTSSSTETDGRPAPPRARADGREAASHPAPRGREPDAASSYDVPRIAPPVRGAPPLSVPEDDGTLTPRSRGSRAVPPSDAEDSLRLPDARVTLRPVPSATPTATPSPGTWVRTGDDRNGTAGGGGTAADGRYTSLTDVRGLPFAVGAVTLFLVLLWAQSRFRHGRPEQ